MPGEAHRMGALCVKSVGLHDEMDMDGDGQSPHKCLVLGNMVNGVGLKCTGSNYN